MIEIFILGISSAIKPIPIGADVIPDILFMTVITIIGAGFAYTQNEIDKKEGIILVILYIIYFAYLVMKYI